MSLVEHLAARLAGRPFALLGATIQVARGRQLLDRSAFAAQLGVPESHVRSWESGARAAHHLPRRIREVAPDLDWAAAGVTPPGDPADPASRHPSGHRG